MLLQLIGICRGSKERNHSAKGKNTPLLAQQLEQGERCTRGWTEEIVKVLGVPTECRTRGSHSWLCLRVPSVEMSQPLGKRHGGRSKKIGVGHIHGVAG